MATIDIILLLILAVTGVIGFRKGIINQIGSLAAIVIAIVACRALSGAAVDMLMGGNPDWETSPVSRYSISILVNCAIYLVAYYGVILAARLLKMVTHAVLLGPIDRIAGAAFSAAKYFLLVSLLLNLYIAVFPATDLVRRSQLAGGKFVAMTIRFAPWTLGTISPFASGQNSPSNDQNKTIQN